MQNKEAETLLKNLCIYCYDAAANINNMLHQYRVGTITYDAMLEMVGDNAEAIMLACEQPEFIKN